MKSLEYLVLFCHIDMTLYDKFVQENNMKQHTKQKSLLKFSENDDPSLLLYHLLDPTCVLLCCVIDKTIDFLHSFDP